MTERKAHKLRANCRYGCNRQALLTREDSLCHECGASFDASLADFVRSEKIYKLQGALHCDGAPVSTAVYEALQFLLEEAKT